MRTAVGMKVIGLTGGIASGKSTVSAYLKDKGIPVIDCDVEAKRILDPGEKAYGDVVNAFGREILFEDGTINRKKLGSIIFGNEEKVKLLNSLTHPEVIRKTNEYLEEYRAKGFELAVVDAPLLIEAGMTSVADEVWLVWIPEEMQIERAVKRDAASREQIINRIKSQMPSEEKKKFADRIISNTGTVEELLKEVDRLLSQTLSQKKEERKMQDYEIRDITLAPEGKRRIEWVKKHMPILSEYDRRYSAEKPLKGKKIAVSVHLEAKTAFLALVLRDLGAECAVTGCNPLSTQDPVAAALVEEGLRVYGLRGATPEEYNRHLNKALDIEPDIIIDDGGDFVNLLHTTRRELLPKIIGGCEETTTGIMRLRAMESEGVLELPMIAVNYADCKHLFDNRYGTGQSVWDGIMRTTNLIVAGKTVVIAGYGWCGRGAAAKAKGLGANVIVTEIDPVKAIEATMDGFRVMTMDEAAPLGDIFVTLTGCRDVITGRHFEKMKDGVLLANAGHFDVEVNKVDLEAMSTETFESRANIMTYRMADGRELNLLAEGRLVNLAAGDGHPAEIMDMSFAIQLQSVLYLNKMGKTLENKLIEVPREIDLQVAEIKLDSMGIKIDKLTEEQKKYVSSWKE